MTSQTAPIIAAKFPVKIDLGLRSTAIRWLTAARVTSVGSETMSYLWDRSTRCLILKRIYILILLRKTPEQTAMRKSRTTLGTKHAAKFRQEVTHTSLQAGLRESSLQLFLVTRRQRIVPFASDPSWFWSECPQSL